jgi:hypothetical protein
MVSNSLIFDSCRRFGVETEYNSFDRRDFKVNRLPRDGSERPMGIERIGQIVLQTLNVPVTINRHHLTHNNNAWILKPDSSCGIEVCSPVSKGTYGLRRICKVIEALGADPKIIIDDRCGLHVHLEVTDCNDFELRSILGYWIKCESVFLDGMPRNRKRNRYCQQLGLSPNFSHETVPELDVLIRAMGMMKYYSMNTHHMLGGSRKTIEVRIAEGRGCIDPYFVKNWVRLLIHFVETCKKRRIVEPYSPDNAFSGLAWLDPEEVFDLLGFNEQLSPGMVQVRNWFLARLKANIDSDLSGVWSGKARSISKAHITRLCDKFGIREPNEWLSPLDMQAALYDLENQC